MSNIDCTLKLYKRARGIRLAIHPGGEITVTAPPYVRRGMVEGFIAEKLPWIIEKQAYLKQFPKKKSSAESRKEYKLYKEQARKYIEERVKYFNKFYQFTYNKIYIRNQKSRWGSCSKKGNINFSYKLLFLPSELADYVVVHELCHLQQLNHSKKFWNLVAETTPDYKQMRKELRKSYPLATVQPQIV